MPNDCQLEINFSYLPIYFRGLETRLCSRRYVTSRLSARFLEDESIFPDCAERFSSTWSDRGTRVENQGKRMREWGNKRKRKGTRERKEKNTTALPVNVFVDSNKKRERAGVLEASSDAQETHTSHVHPFIRPSISPWRLNANARK